MIAKEWYWYIANSSELFVDLDHPVGGPLRRLDHARARLNGAIAAGKLSVIDWYLYQSFGPWHYHLMIHTANVMTPLARVMWEARLADDGYRHLMSLARLVATSSLRSYSLLISPSLRNGYHRDPDYFCRCPGKHKGEIMERCPIARLIGPNVTLSADYFGTPIYIDSPVITGKQINPDRICDRCGFVDCSCLGGMRK